MGFSRQEYWSGLPFPSPEIFPTQGLNPSLPHCRQMLYHLSLQGSLLFIIGDWNAKVGSQEIPGVTGRFGLEVQNEAGQRLTEFCQENTLVIANTFFQQHNRRLYTWTSSDGQHRNQVDYSLQPKMEKLYTVSKNRTRKWL